MKIVETATVTAVDMISNIGGTLGLFTGFSLLSGVEILYWIFKCGQSKAKRTKPKIIAE